MARTLVLLFSIAVAAPASACSIPVFRFALEQWPASKYELLIVHRGPLSVADQTLAGRYREEAKLANVVVKDVDLNGTVEEKLKAVVLRDLGSSALPKLLLRYPDTDEKVPSAWSGWMTPDSLSTLSFSPARDVLFERLTSGNAAAVLLLLSGDATADEAARTTLSRELPRIARRIDLPKQTEEGPQLTSELPLKVDFPVIEVHRDGREDTLVKLLLGSEEGLTEEIGRAHV